MCVAVEMPHFCLLNHRSQAKEINPFSNVSKIYARPPILLAVCIYLIQCAFAVCVVTVKLCYHDCRLELLSCHFPKAVQLISVCVDVLQRCMCLH